MSATPRQERLIRQSATPQQERRAPQSATSQQERPARQSATSRRHRTRIAASGLLVAGGLLVAIALCGCETTEEKSAALERAAHLHVHRSIAKVVSVKRQSHAIEVVQSTIVTGKEATAVVVTLRNRSSQPIAAAPLEIDLAGRGGHTVYTNAVPGLAESLISAPLLPAHGEATWVDDQVELSGTASSVKAFVGEGKHLGQALPAMRVEHVRRIEGGLGATGTVVNPSAVEQRELVIYALARRGGKIVAAGRGIVPELAAHGSAQFDTYLIGEAKGSTLQLSAPPSTF